jgi:hypothetical protein
MARMNTSLLMHFLKSSRFTGITGERRELIIRNKENFIFQVKKYFLMKMVMVREGKLTKYLNSISSFNSFLDMIY